MLRKLSLVAVAALSLGAAALAPTSASAWGGGGWRGGGGMAVAVGTVAGVARASMSAARPITDPATAAAMSGNWSRRPGGRAGV